jgi:hypothetical protein
MLSTSISNRSAARSSGPGRTRLRTRVAVGLAGAILGSCVINSNDRCSDHQVMWGDGVRCVCDEDSAWTDAGCVPCGKHEVPGSNGCVCEQGYTRATAADPCKKAPSGQGVACDTTSAAACTDPTYNFCQVVSGTTGYCTKVGCTSSDDCEGGYACDTTKTPKVCLRPPTGIGQSCTSDADCAGTEATYCDTFVNHACLVQGCTVDPDNCFPGWECCDLTAFGFPAPLCIPEGDCTT